MAAERTIGTADVRGLAEANAALERARSLTQAQAIELDRLLDALEAEREKAAAARELTRAAEAASGALRAQLASAFDAFLDSPSWQLGNGLADAPRRLLRRPPSGTPSAARTSCAVLVRAGAGAPGSAAEGQRLADVQYWATRVLDGRRYRLGQLLVRLLPWLTDSRRPEHELRALLRAARAQHEAARAALGTATGEGGME